MFRNAGQLVFRQREDHRNWLQLREDQHWVGVGGVNDISGVNLAQANSSVERSRDVAVDDVQLCRFDLRLIGAHVPSS